MSAARSAGWPSEDTCYGSMYYVVRKTTEIYSSEVERSVIAGLCDVLRVGDRN